MKNKKILTNLLASTILLNNFVLCFAKNTDNLVKNNKIKISSFVSERNNKKPKITTKNIQKNDSDAVINWMNNHKTLTAILGTVALADFFNILEWNTKPKVLKSECEKYFYDVKPSAYTKRQEGVMWCALACLQGLLKYENIKISQKKIYKGAFGDIWYTPFFEVHRIKGGLSLYSGFNDYLDLEYNEEYGLYPGLVDSERLKKIKEDPLNSKSERFEFDNNKSLPHDKISTYIEKVTKNQYTYKVGFITVNNKSKTEFKKHIIIQMKDLLEHHKIFSILDSCAYLRCDELHFVIVTNIDNSNMLTIEDPASGYSYRRSLDGFARGLSEITDRDKTKNDKLLRKKGIMFAYLEKNQ